MQILPRGLKSSASRTGSTGILEILQGLEKRIGGLDAQVLTRRGARPIIRKSFKNRSKLLVESAAESFAESFPRSAQGKRKLHVRKI